MTTGIKNVLGLAEPQEDADRAPGGAAGAGAPRADALRDALERFGADVAPGDARTLDDTIAHLDELFLLVIAGEFNSGKSSFINALLGEKVLAEGVTPTTDRITLLRYGDEPAEQPLEEFLLERDFPADVLQRLTIVDTPGTNAIIRRHEELTRDFVPRSDLVLFVTSADRPFTESERAFLATIQEWGKKIVIVLNKVDLLEQHEVDAGRRLHPRERARPARLHARDLPGLGAAGPARAADGGRRRSLGGPAASTRSSAISWRRWTRSSACGSSCSRRWAWRSTWPTNTWRSPRAGWRRCRMISRRSTISSASSTCSATT